MLISYRAGMGLLFGILLTPLAQAALDVGDRAPDFSTKAAKAGEPFQFSLAAALAKGPGGSELLSGRHFRRLLY